MGKYLNQTLKHLHSWTALHMQPQHSTPHRSTKNNLLLPLIERHVRLRKGSGERGVQTESVKTISNLVKAWRIQHFADDLNLHQGWLRLNLRQCCNPWTRCLMQMMCLDALVISAAYGSGGDLVLRGRKMLGIRVAGMILNEHSLTFNYSQSCC